MIRRAVTQADVARVAGTSAAVVSYVVNGGPRPVAADTRARVLDAVARTGYRPDGIARALATGSTGTYGFILPNIANPFIAALAHAVEDEAYRRGFTLLLGDSADDTKREADLVDTFLQRRIDGLLFYGVDRHHPSLNHVVGRVPVVVLDEPGEVEGVHYVHVDERAAAAAATAHLLDHGYGHVTTISGPRRLENSRDRVQGWRDALIERGLDVDDQSLVEAEYTRRGGYLAATRIFESRPLPDAVFAANEQQALGFLAAAHDHGVRVPQDIAVICFNGTTNAEYSSPGLTTIEQPVEEIAAVAIQLLANPPVDGPRARVCDIRLVRRRSCGCTPLRPASTLQTAATGGTSV